MQRREGGEAAELLIGVECQSCEAKKVLEREAKHHNVLTATDCTPKNYANDSKFYVICVL